MIAIIAPEPAAWVEPVARAAGALGDTCLVAPWVMSSGRTLTRLAGRRVAFLRRRLMDGELAELARSPLAGLGALQAAARLWARSHTDRMIWSQLANRAVVDAAAARWLRTAGRVEMVIASSCAARASFAVAAELGARTVLIEDMPALRQLHADLDAAAAAHPRCVFLRRYRAPRWAVARQEVEWVLAGRLLVRGELARRHRLAHGVAEPALLPMPAHVHVHVAPAAPPVAGGPGRRRALRVLLAGLAAARHGTMELCAALDECTDIELVVRSGEGMEPAGLLSHPRVRPARAEELGTLAGIDAVVCPAWCETYPVELARALASGVPVVATDRSSGWAAGSAERDALGLRMVERGDVWGLAAALRGLERGERQRAAAVPWTPAVASW